MTTIECVLLFLTLIIRDSMNQFLILFALCIFTSFVFIFTD